MRRNREEIEDQLIVEYTIIYASMKWPAYLFFCVCVCRILVTEVTYIYTNVY